MTLLALGVTLASPSRAADPVSRTIDRRAKKDATVRYIVFCSRDSPGSNPPGHAFVVYGRDEAADQVCRVDDAFGAYPKDGKLGIWTVPGEIASEFVKRQDADKKELPWSCRLVVKVDDDQFNKAEAVRRKWMARGEFRLVARDCVVYVDEVAEAIGVRNRPERAGALLPETYIRKLTEGNR